MKSSFKYKDKNAGTQATDVRAKARLTIQGCNDPDLEILERDAPTVQKIFVHFLFTLAAAFDWLLFGADAKLAFMQGGPAPERRQRIFMEQPRDGIIGNCIPGLVPGALLEVIGAVYGLINAPRLWYEAFAKRMVKAGWVIHSPDCAVFLFYQGGRISAMVCLHVDDALIGASRCKKGEKALQDLREAFEWGAWREDVGEYLGHDVARREGDIHLSQRTFLDALGCADLPEA